VSRTTTEQATRRSRWRRTVVVVTGVVLLLALTGCSEETEGELKRLGLPEAASNRAPYMHDLWIGSWIAAGIIGVFVWGLIGWVIVRYWRRSDDELPSQVRYNLPIEVLYTIAPVIAVAVLFFFTVEKQNNILEDVENPDHSVLVTAQQWSWTFSYLGEEAADGEDVYESGTSAELPELWLVKGQSVTFTLHSPDVIHDFWVPSFYFKQDVIPGRDEQFSMTPTKEGSFAGRCAELCGAQHSRMLFTVRIVDQEAYDAHIRQLLDDGQIGAPRGGVNSEEIAGLEKEESGEQE
jgi:cytochrome c oxidase subunit II